jgi:hypothetical protein
MGRIGQNRVKEFIAWDHQAGPYVSALVELLGPVAAHRDGTAGENRRKKQEREVINVTGNGLAGRHR